RVAALVGVPIRVTAVGCREDGGIVRQTLRGGTVHAKTWHQQECQRADERAERGSLEASTCTHSCLLEMTWGDALRTPPLFLLDVFLAHHLAPARKLLGQELAEVRARHG